MRSLRVLRVSVWKKNSLCEKNNTLCVRKNSLYVRKIPYNSNVAVNMPAKALPRSGACRKMPKTALPLPLMAA